MNNWDRKDESRIEACFLSKESAAPYSSCSGQFHTSQLASGIAYFIDTRTPDSELDAHGSSV